MGVWLFRLPGVYRPQPDTWLLARAVRRVGMSRGARVLDVGTGTGALALVAAENGAGEITAIETFSPAAWSARVNVALRRVPVRVLQVDVASYRPDRPYDLVMANPPYVPSRSTVPSSRRAVAWDAGPDGRSLVDLLCDQARSLLAPSGSLLMVHSAVCGVERTLERLRAARLKAAVVARRTVPFGPVMRSRAAELEAKGLIRPGQLAEELVVVRADRVDGT